MPPSTNTHELCSLPAMTDDSNDVWKPFDDEDWDDSVAEARDFLDPKRRVSDDSRSKRSPRSPSQSRGPSMVSSSHSRSSSNSPRERVSADDRLAAAEAFGTADPGPMVRRSLSMNMSSNSRKSVHARSKSPSRRSGGSGRSGAERKPSKSVERSKASLSPKQRRSRDQECSNGRDNSNQGEENKCINRNSSGRSPRRTKSSDGSRSKSPKKMDPNHRRSTSPTCRSRRGVPRTASGTGLREQRSAHRRQLVARTSNESQARSQHRRGISETLALHRSQSIRLGRSNSGEDSPTNDRRGQHSIRVSRSISHGESPALKRQESMRGARTRLTRSLTNGDAPVLQRQNSMRGARARVSKSLAHAEAPLLQRQESLRGAPAAARVPRSDRINKALPRKCKSLEDGYDLDDEAKQRMGLIRGSPTAGGSTRRLNAASETSPSQSLPYRRTMSMGFDSSANSRVAKQHLSKAMAIRERAARANASIDKRPLKRTMTEERRLPKTSFQDTCDSTLKAFVPESFVSGKVDVASSSLEDKVVRMKELGRGYRQSSKRQLMGKETGTPDQESPRLRRAGAKTA